MDQQYIIPVVGKENVTSSCDDLVLINPFSTQYKSFSHDKMVELLQGFWGGVRHLSLWGTLLTRDLCCGEGHGEFLFDE